MNRILVTVFAGALLAGTAAMADDVKKPEVNRRETRQQKRIGQGVTNGSLTAKETKNIEKKEVAVHKEIREERKENGGKLTPEEKKQVNQQQNKLSREIYRKKHNDKQQ